MGRRQPLADGLVDLGQGAPGLDLVPVLREMGVTTLFDADHAVGLLSRNALAFYGERLAERIAARPAEADEPRPAPRASAERMMAPTLCESWMPSRMRSSKSLKL